MASYTLGLGIVLSIVHFVGEVKKILTFVTAFCFRWWRQGHRKSLFMEKQGTQPKEVSS